MSEFNNCVYNVKAATVLMGQLVAEPRAPPEGASLADKIEFMQEELDLPADIVNDLISIVGVDIVAIVIADDSGSMGAVANYVTRSTRWTESGAVWKPNVATWAR